MLLERLLSNLSVHVQPFALCTVCEGWRLALPGNPETTIHFVLEGKGRVVGPLGDSHRLESFVLAVVPRGTKHSLEASGKIDSELKVESPPPATSVCQVMAGAEGIPALKVACGVVTVRYGQSFGFFDYLHSILSVNLSRHPEVKNAFAAILSEQSHPGPGGGTMTSALMTASLVHFFRELSGAQANPLPWLSALEDRRLGRVVDTILKEPGAAYSVERLADVAAMSRSAFSERFHEAFDHSPMNFVNHVRMQRAVQLLNEGPRTMDELATELGYSSRSHFSAAFKKHHGVSPAEYRMRGNN